MTTTTLRRAFGVISAGAITPLELDGYVRSGIVRPVAFRGVVMAGVVIDAAAPYSSGTSPFGLTIVDNGDGTFTATGAGAVDHGDGTYTLTDPGLVDNGDGTFTVGI